MARKHSRREYARYLESPAWKSRRDRYYYAQGGSEGYVCCVAGCGVRERLELNHLTYAHAGEGKERAWELCWFCGKDGNDHHKMFHEGLVQVTVGRPVRLLWKRKYREITYDGPPK